VTTGSQQVVVTVLGFVDDVHGWDFVHNDNAGVYPPPSVYTGDVDDHGIHVASTIGANGNNGQGVAGINWQVSIDSLAGASFAPFLCRSSKPLSDSFSTSALPEFQHPSIR
jgi:subtilisin family serine protease